MKKTLIFALLSSLPAAAQWRHFGQEQVRFTGDFGVGVATPLNPAARQLDTGWSLSGGIGATGKYVGVKLDANFVDFGLNSDTLYNLGARHGSQKFWSLTVDPVFHVNQHGPIDFYVTGGGGLYSQITDVRTRFYGGPYDGGEFLLSNTIYKPGVNGGAGFAFNIGGHHNRVKLFTEARFHHMFVGNSGVSYIPITIGVRY